MTAYSTRKESNCPDKSRAFMMFLVPFISNAIIGFSFLGCFCMLLTMDIIKVFAENFKYL